MEKLEQTPMSDEVKERIKSDAHKYVKKFMPYTTTTEDLLCGYVDGATAERPKAWNEAIDEAISELKESIRNDLKIRLQSSARIEQQLSLNEIIKHVDGLEKLKHKQP